MASKHDWEVSMDSNTAKHVADTVNKRMDAFYALKRAEGELAEIIMADDELMIAIGSGIVKPTFPTGAWFKRQVRERFNNRM